jgi:hypothetical protein
MRASFCGRVTSLEFATKLSGLTDRRLLHQLTCSIQRQLEDFVAVLSILTIKSVAKDRVQNPVKSCSEVALMHIENTVIFTAKEVPEGTPIGQVGPMPQLVRSRPVVLWKGRLTSTPDQTGMRMAINSSGDCPKPGLGGFCSKGVGLCRDRATTTYKLLDLNGTDSPFSIL